MISVCIATYNGGGFINRQLDSLVKQLSEEDEVIIVDDQSSDETLDCITHRKDDRIRVFKNKENKGPIQSFEKAIKQAKGDVIFLCDQDDIWCENKVEVVMDIFHNTNTAVVVHDAIVVDKDLVEIAPSWNEMNSNNTKPTVFSTFVKNGFTGCMMAFKREMKGMILPFPSSIEMHDQWIGLVALLQELPVRFIDDRLMLYVRHGENVTALRKRTPVEKIQGRMKTFRSLEEGRKRRKFGM